LIPHFVLWANLHGGFMAGLVVLGCFGLEALLALRLACWRREDAGPRLRALIWLASVSVGCFLATLGTPYGFHLYELAVRVMDDPLLTEVIYELQPPDWNYVWIVDAAWVVFLLAALRPVRLKSIAWACLAGGLLIAFYRMGPGWTEDGDLGWTPWPGARRAAWYTVLVFCGGRSKNSIGLGLTLQALFFTYQGLNHVRHLPLMGVALAPLAAYGLADWLKQLQVETFRPSAEMEMGSNLRDAVIGTVRLGAPFMLLYYLFVPGEAYAIAAARGGVRDATLRAPTLLDRNLGLLRGTELEPGAYPVEAVEYLLRARPPGRLFNGGNYAGYLIWRLSPEKYKVFTDNRYDVYGSRFLREEHLVLDGFEGDPASDLLSWREIVGQWDIRILFIPTDCGLHRRLLALAAESTWRLAHQDGQFAVWVLTP
jgi:hypothetical protein